MKRILTLLPILCCVALLWTGLYAEEFVDGVNPDVPSDVAYNATSWNGNLSAATKNVIRDQIETMTDADSTDVFTNKTFDASATGNVLKTYKYLDFANPNGKEGAGLTAGRNTTGTNSYYGQVTFSNSADEATNCVDYRVIVPPDIDTSSDTIVAYFKFQLGGADTGDHDYRISMLSIGDSEAYDGTPGTTISLAYTADGSGASGDVETATATLTGWAAAWVAGEALQISMCRDGNDGTNDASTVDSYSGALRIYYPTTQ